MKNNHSPLSTLHSLLKILGTWVFGYFGIFLLGYFVIPSWAIAQEDDSPRRSRAAAGIDRRAKHLYDKAMELIEYKQYERGLEMLNSVVRDNQGTLLAHMAHMAIGKHHLEQHKHKEALSHFLLLTRVLAPEPGETQTQVWPTTNRVSSPQVSLFSED
jgi:predicted negative regulator of RcsB-dependent stress response